MKKLGLVLGLMAFTLTAFVCSEPTVNSSGSVQVIGTAGSKGMSSFRSEFYLTVEVNLNNYLSGVVQTKGITSAGHSSTDLRQGYLMIGNLNGTNPTGSKVTNFYIAEDLYKDPKYFDKMIAKVNNFSLPEKNSVLTFENKELKTNSTHSLILADLTRTLFEKRVETKQPHSVETMRLSKSN